MKNRAEYSEALDDSRDIKWREPAPGWEDHPLPPINELWDEQFCAGKLLRFRDRLLQHLVLLTLMHPVFLRWPNNHIWRNTTLCKTMTKQMIQPSGDISLAYKNDSNGKSPKHGSSPGECKVWGKGLSNSSCKWRQLIKYPWKLKFLWYFFSENFPCLSLSSLILSPLGEKMSLRKKGRKSTHVYRQSATWQTLYLIFFMHCIIYAHMYSSKISIDILISQWRLWTLCQNCFSKHLETDWWAHSSAPLRNLTGWSKYTQTTHLSGKREKGIWTQF